MGEGRDWDRFFAKCEGYLWDLYLFFIVEITGAER